MRIILLLFLYLGGWGTETAYSEIQTADEYKVKAAFLLNFGKFVQWPADVLGEASESIILGILGKDEFGELIDKLAETVTIQDKKLEIIRFKNIQDVKPCHILFISSSEKGQVEEILKKIKDWHVLTVSEVKRFAHQGGMINFKMVNNKIRFEVNQKAAEQEKLKVSSQLLRLGISVESNSS